jgi:hypothetical protein
MSSQRHEQPTGGQGSERKDENDNGSDLQILKRLKAAAELRKHLPRKFDSDRGLFYIDVSGLNISAEKMAESGIGQEDLQKHK